MHHQSKTTTKEKKSPTPTQSINRRSSRNKKRNNGIPYYSSPVVSAPLVTAFGLPTLIECEPPTLPSIEIETPSSPQKIFTSLKERSKSLPLSPSSPTATNIKQQQQQRARSKSYISEDSTESATQQDNTITASLHTPIVLPLSNLTNINCIYLKTLMVLIVTKIQQHQQI